MTQSSKLSEVSRTFPARFESLAAICDFVTQRAEVAGLGPRAVYAVQIAVDEACSNIIEHAYGAQRPRDALTHRGTEHAPRVRRPPTIKCTCRTQPGRLVIQLHDHGRPFDPSSVPKPDLQSDLSERHAGGLGVYFIQQLMDAVHFESSPGHGNTLTLVKRRKPPNKPDTA
jgi:serine/threonine-protein kinase RsbW